MAQLQQADFYLLRIILAKTHRFMRNMLYEMLYLDN